MSTPDDVLIYRGIRLEYDRLCLAVRQSAQSRNPTPAQLEALAELQACRAQIASPLHRNHERGPSHQDRSQLTNSAGITVLINPDNSNQESRPVPIRLGSDLVSVAIALSDELQINEVDAAILLYDARDRAARRSDHDVVAAAKELFLSRRRESLLYLQQIIRAGLNHPEDIIQADTFLSSLLKERDLLITDHRVFHNVTDRLNDALQGLTNTQIPSWRQLAVSEERLLLAETLFLLSYTVQLGPEEAGSLYSLLLRAQEAIRAFSVELNPRKPEHSFSIALPIMPGQSSARLQLSAVDIDRLRGIQNLMFLSWTAALDRSRYHNIYNPRTGCTGVNELLKDHAFVQSTLRIPTLEDGEEDKIATTGPVVAAAELCGSLFRLAVAVPDEEEAVTTFLRASAYGDAFSYLSEELVEWIQEGAGSLAPDTDLYADVVEDLALDMAEAPRLVAALVQFAQNETYELATNFNLESLRSISIGRAPESSMGNQDLWNSDSKGRYSDRLEAKTDLFGSESIRPPGNSRGRRASRMMMQASPSTFTSGGLRGNSEGSFRRAQEAKQWTKAEESSKTSAAFLISDLAQFVAKAVAAAPEKLKCDSVGGGMRYWVGIGQSSIGFIPRIGDAVIDMWDTAMRNSNAPDSVNVAFQCTLHGFLLLLKTTSESRGSPAHAVASLKYLRHGGHPVASLDRAMGALSYIAESLSASNSNVALDDAETKAICDILNVVSTAAEALESHGGVVPVLEDSGRELASRLSSFVLLTIPIQLREAGIKCLRALNFSRTVPILLETLSADKCAVLRHWARGEEAPSKSFAVSLSVMRLVKRSLDGTNSCSEKTLRNIAIYYIIEEILSFWTRRAYSAGSQRWEILAIASEILVQLLTKSSSSTFSQQIATSLLQAAPGTGSASYAFQALSLGAGLVTKEEQMITEYRGASGIATEQDKLLSGRDLLTHIAWIGHAQTFRWMRQAVYQASRLLSVLLLMSPGRLSRFGVVTSSAVELLAGDAECLTSASTLVYAPDAFDPILSRAGYGLHLSATVLSLLGRAAQGSRLIASILTKDRSGSHSAGTASQFRASLARILLDMPSGAGDSPKESGSESTVIEEQVLFEEPALYGVLRVVEACLGPDGCGAPGMFLLGFPTDAFGRRGATEHGILGALIELVAGVNPYQPVDDPNRASAATFLERLVSHTAKDTSAIVLGHIRSISEVDSSVRGGGFGDELLFRMVEDVHQGEASLAAEFDWSSYTTLLSACMKLSALQIRMFPQVEKQLSDSLSNIDDPSFETETDSLVQGTFSKLPSPLVLIELLSRAVGYGEQSGVSDAFGAWSKLVGIRLSVHSEGKGYANEAVLFEIVIKLLSALSSDTGETGLEILVRINNGETACATILDCVVKLAKCYTSRAKDTRRAITEHQFLTITDGLCRCLVILSRAGSRSERARTFLYGTLLSLCLPRHGEEESKTILSRAFCKGSSEMGGVGVDTLIDIACSDALLGHSNATKSASVALVARLVAYEPSRALQALASQNRFRRMVAAAFPSVLEPRSQGRGDSRSIFDSGGDRLGMPMTRAVLALFEAISVTSSGGRLLADGGCIETLGQVLAIYETGPVRKHVRKLVGSLASVSGPNMSPGSQPVPMTVAINQDELGVSHSSLLPLLTSALAAAIRCGGENVVEDVVYAIDKGRSGFLEILRSLQAPDEAELNTVCALGMTLSRVPPHLVSAAVFCSQLRSKLAYSFGKILPPVTKTQRLGKSGSFLSVGIHLKHPAAARTAKRAQIAHPEGGSLYERDIVRARAVALRNIFSTFIQRNAMPFLFAADLRTSRFDQAAVVSDQGSTSGNLAGVLRIAQAMLKETNHSTKEGIHLSRQAAGDVRPSMNYSTEAELYQFCEEEYGVHREFLDLAQVRDCLKKESSRALEHAAVCLRVLEMSLVILREYICNAVDIARGDPVSKEKRQEDGAGIGAEEWGEMSVDKASSFLEDARHTIIPFCKEVESTQDLVGDTNGTFSRQMCRHIRATCPA